MPAAKRRSCGWILYLFIAGLAVTSSGCLLAVAGLCAGGAAAGYCYYKGRIYHDFPAPLPDVRNAIHAALLDLQFPIFTEELKDGKAFFITKTTAGKKVRIYADALSSPIPAEKVLTRVSIRVATFGDEGVSSRIFEQITFRLSHLPAAVPAPPDPTLNPPAPVEQTSSVKPFETTPPPIAPQSAKKQ
jgi:hypothetical protein